MTAVPDHFALFDLPRRYGIDLNALEQRYRALQSEVHPDKHAHLGSGEKLRSMQLASNVNEAMHTLKSPLKRASYLLHLAGQEVGAESNTTMPGDFLLEQMELREAVGDARDARDEDALDRLRSDLRARMMGQYAALGEFLDVHGNLAAAADSVRRLMFQEKLLQEIDDALEAIEA